MLNDKCNILFLGCGKMGSAILNNFLAKKILAKNIQIIDPNISNEIPNIKYFSDISQIDQNCHIDLVILAFKPQNADHILPKIVKSTIFSTKTIFISILAGKKFEFFNKFFDNEQKIIRIMPNLPIAVGAGLSGFVANKNLHSEEINFIMNIWSENIQLQSEEEMNLFTAIAGSGPGYLFFFAKSLIDATIELGMDKERAIFIVKKMLFGSAKMLLEDNSDVENLIQSVASKGGTTEAGLAEFENANFNKIAKKIVQSAFIRSKEL